jgi:hypothetical protein
MMAATMTSQLSSIKEVAMHWLKTCVGLPTLLFLTGGCLETATQKQTSVSRSTRPKIVVPTGSSKAPQTQPTIYKAPSIREPPNR